ncbi:unnamed protein product [Clonostachys rhizophaga]|uniref:CHAT domain-containing protein n=1 Tax=Clonostachys rhizophaga TaxID=160324 RepID=A0A9N9YXL2_9HYPO|nr:unnamed protein product [Clonostachys rhizophaga]
MASYKKKNINLNDFDDSGLICFLERLNQSQHDHPAPPADAGQAALFEMIATHVAKRRLARNDEIGHKLNDHEITLRRRAVDLTPPSHSTLIMRRLVAADVLLERFEKRDRTIEDLKLAFEVIGPDNGALVDYLLVFGRIQRCRFIENLDQSALDTAIEVLRQYSISCPPSELVQLYGNLLITRYRNTAIPKDLEEGIKQAEDASKGGSEDNKIFALSNLAEFLPFMFELKNGAERALLEKAVESAQMANSLAIKNKMEDIDFVYGALAHAFYHRYLQSRDPDHLKQALENGNEAVRRCKTGELSRATWLNNLGLAYLAKFRQKVNITSLDKASESFRLAVQESRLGSQTHFLSLNNLADAHGLRFEWTGETEALDIAVSKYRELVNIPNTNELRRAEALQNLGNILLHAYRRHHKLENLDEAISSLRQSLEKYPTGHKDVPVVNSFLCRTLVIRGKESIHEDRMKQDISSAIECGEEARKSAAQDDSQRHVILNNLSLAYFFKWKSERNKYNRETLKKAISYSEQTLEATHQDAPDRASHLGYHGNLLSAEIWDNDAEAESSSFSDPLKCYKEAVYLPNGLPLMRINAGRLALRILADQKNWEEASEIGLATMELIPLACGKYLSLQDQQQMVFQTSGLAAEMCSLMLELGKPDESLERLEAGRAIILGLSMNDSDELSALESTNKNLATEFKDIKARLRAPHDPHGRRLGEERLQEKWNAEAELTRCLEKIRKIDGYKDFLRQPSKDRMKSLSEKQIVVLVISTYLRSDAIIIRGLEIKSVPLPMMELDKLKDYGSQLTSNFPIADLPAKRAMEVISMSIPIQTRQTSQGFLNWLWVKCVQPILSEIGIGGSQNGMPRILPRIWWIGSGAAANFPFHAAAASECDSHQDTMSLVISSYTPSLKTLLHAMRRSKQSQIRRIDYQKENPSLGIITMKTTPGGYGDLPATEKEREVVMNLTESKWNCTSISQPTADVALQAIRDSDIVHFACHGIADSRDPLESHLVLEKPSGINNEMEVDKLTVSQILSIDELQKPWIAFLSACTTTSMGGLRLLDEGLHMSGALQVAGFPHTVGSLWSVEDSVSVSIAQAFYKNLLRLEYASIDDRAVAAAVREAVIDTRRLHPTPWANWAAYVHSGA